MAIEFRGQHFHEFRVFRDGQGLHVCATVSVYVRSRPLFNLCQLILDIELVPIRLMSVVFRFNGFHFHWDALQ